MPAITPLTAVAKAAPREPWWRCPGRLARIARAATLAAWCAGLATTMALAADSVGLSSVRAQRFGRADLLNANVGGGDQFAFAFAVGDFDGDGADDLATGAPGNDGAGAQPVDECGQVLIRYGISGAGLDPTSAPVVLGQFVAGGAEEADKFGSALAACDLNGDGFDDLAVGVPFEDLTLGGLFTIVDSGVVEIYYGTSGGLMPPASTVLSSNGIEAGEQRLGLALACGDFDGDGFDDLVAGLPGRTVNEQAFAGRIRIYSGSSAGIGAEVLVIDQDSTGMLDDAELGDQFGAQLAAGNFDGDSFADLAIGVPLEVTPLAGSRGAVQVLFGSADGLTADRDQVFYNPESPASGGYTGFALALAAGSFDGDAADELAVGSFADHTDEDDAGSVYVYAGSPGGLLGFQRLSPDLILGAGASAFAEYFGTALAAADFDGDGADDLATGSPGEALLGTNDGAVTVLMGAVGTGFDPGTSRARQLNHGVEGIPGTAAEDGLHFGRALAAGDFDGDSHADLAIGAPYEGETFLPTVGTATILYGALFADGFESANTDYWGP